MYRHVQEANLVRKQHGLATTIVTMATTIAIVIGTVVIVVPWTLYIHSAMCVYAWIPVVNGIMMLKPLPQVLLEKQLYTVVLEIAKKRLG
jgi:hypothetical protein